MHEWIEQDPAYHCRRLAEDVRQIDMSCCILFYIFLFVFVRTSHMVIINKIFYVCVVVHLGDEER